MDLDCRVVLVEPENPLNVGFAARAMKAFGASDLRVVSSCWKRLPPEAGVSGACARDILEGARLEKTLPDALRGCASAVAFSRRPTSLRHREFVLPSFPELGGKVALVFGRESTGLTRAESAPCPYLARIPCRNGISLNLGQAVAVALFSLAAPAGAPTAQEPAAAGLDRMLSLWEYLEPRLSCGPRASQARLRRIRQMFYRLRLDDDDFSMLFSVMKTLSPRGEASSAR
ncbi:MAG: RNA methyltransferase [Elusimicrobiota bacterium]